MRFDTELSFQRMEKSNRERDKKYKQNDLPISIVEEDIQNQFFSYILLFKDLYAVPYNS